MKENTKIIIACVITLILGTIINATATTILQANSVSYKTSNGDTTDVNSALDRLFDINTVNEKIGNTDISSIGDGTVTGAVSNLNSNLNNLGKSIVLLTDSSLADGESFKITSPIDYSKPYILIAQFYVGNYSSSSRTSLICTFNSHYQLTLNRINPVSGLIRLNYDYNGSGNVTMNFYGDLSTVAHLHSLVYIPLSV